MLIAKRVIFHGRVQGVNFRANASELAVSLGLNGWIRNLPDGTVEAHFEGNEERIMEMIERSKTELFPAIVDGVDIEDTPTENHSSFSVIR
ncbi:MAG: acylphosphatase [Candidatus Thermoplasmatota archaeon]|jgi:acylphosphatase|nr:acylphosphatase [Candidatus Thermoplasmatota archaeon]